MRRSSIFFFLAATVLGAFAMGQSASMGSGSSSGLDMTLPARAHFRGRVAFTGDLDRVEIPLLEGTRLSLKVKREPGFKVKPRLVLLKDGVSLEPAPKKNKVLKKGVGHRLNHIKITESGDYEVQVWGKGLHIGTYLLKVMEEFPGKVKKSLKMVAGDREVVTIPAQDGSIMELTLKTNKAGDSVLTVPTLTSPSGIQLDLSGVTQVLNDSLLLEIGPVVLPERGNYTLRIDEESSVTRKTKLTATIDDSHLTAIIIDEDLGAADLSGGLDLGDGHWVPESEPQGSFSSDEILVRVDRYADAARVAAQLSGQVDGVAPDGWVRIRKSVTSGLVQASADSRKKRVASLCRKARTYPGVREVEPNYRRGSFGDPSDPLFAEQWDLPICRFNEAWTAVSGDMTRCVAVLDTGIRYEHPDLAGHLLPGYDFVGESWNAGDGDGYDNDPTDMFLSMGTHGTHVTGTIAAVSNNGLGIVGGVPNIHVMPVRVLGVLGGTDFDIAQGILYAAGLPNASGTLPSTSAEVINMSLGGPNYSTILHDAVKQAVDAGVVIVAAAGNSNSTLPMYPAAYPEVMAVSATDALDERAFYSSYGDHVDIAAPGGDSLSDKNGDGVPDGILSTVVDPGLGATYSRKMGTSMAAPHVAAAAFMLRSANPVASSLEVRAYLAAGATDVGAPGRDEEFGFGRLDVMRSLDLMQGSGAGPMAPLSIPTTLDFGKYTDRLEVITINEGGNGPISVTAVRCDAFWVQPLQFSGTTPFTCEVQVSRLGLFPGIYSSSIQIFTTQGITEIPVTMQVDDHGPVGILSAYVLAIDVATGEVVDSIVVDEQSPEVFQFSNLPEGTYWMVGATDLDFDGVVAENHDYVGQALDPVSLEPMMVLVDGGQVSGASIILDSGGAGNMTVGGNIQLPTP